MPRRIMPEHPDEMHRIWNELWAGQIFDQSTETAVSTRLRDALIEIYETNLGNTVLAAILGTEPGKTQKRNNYTEKIYIPGRVGSVLWIKKASVSTVLERLGTKENINTIIEDSTKIGSKKMRKAINTWIEAKNRRS